MESTKDINAGIVSGISQVIDMKKRLVPHDHTVTVVTERHNLDDGYKITKVTKTKHDKSLLDIFIDLFS